MTSLSTFQQVVRLFRLVSHLRDGHDLRPDDRAALADALAAYLSDAAPDLDSAMGLKPAPGERDWRTASALARRNALIHACVVQYFPGLPIAAQAEELHQAMTRYAATGWVRERLLEAPLRRAGTIQQACWEILKVRDHVLSARAIRLILARS